MLSGWTVGSLAGSVDKVPDDWAWRVGGQLIHFADTADGVTDGWVDLVDGQLVDWLAGWHHGWGVWWLGMWFTGGIDG